jgi:hypothetical protein
MNVESGLDLIETSGLLICRRTIVRWYIALPRSTSVGW